MCKDLYNALSDANVKNGGSMNIDGIVLLATSLYELLNDPVKGVPPPDKEIVKGPPLSVVEGTMIGPPQPQQQVTSAPSKLEKIAVSCLRRPN